MKSNGFEAGDIVEWTSQSGGYRSTKRGEVIEIVGAGKVPEPGSAFPNPGSSRGHKSYVVRACKVVDGKLGKRYGCYWPRAKALRLVY